MGRLSQILSTIERVVVIIAATLAVFPLWQYWSEAEDRKRERAVQELQLTAHCMLILREVWTRDKEYFSQFKNLTGDQLDKALAEAYKINGGQIHEDKDSIEYKIIGKCARMGAISDGG